MEKAYPTRWGMPLSTAEIELPQSELDPNNDYNWNNHHLFFSASTYRHNLILNSLRNLEKSQERMLKDQHNMGRLALHSLYMPFKPPSLSQAMERLEEAYQDGEQFKVYDQEAKLYLFHDFTPVHYKQLQICYNLGEKNGIPTSII